MSPNYLFESANDAYLDCEWRDRSHSRRIPQKVGHFSLWAVKNEETGTEQLRVSEITAKSFGRPTPARELVNWAMHAASFLAFQYAGIEKLFRYHKEDRRNF
jgi:hypothetical protein